LISGENNVFSAFTAWTCLSVWSTQQKKKNPKSISFG